MPSERQFDIVLFGGSGFTGSLTAGYLAGHAPAGLRWALAGRDPAKLEGVRRNFANHWSEVPVLSADLSDESSLRRLAESARVVITTVGPFADYGEPLVAACAGAGTDYVDISGEPEFVDRCYVRYHARAVETGARLVHCCGFDSVPHDLGAYFTVQQLPEEGPIRVRGFVRAAGSFSAGTYRTALIGFSRARATLSAVRERTRLEPRPADRRARAVAGCLHWDPDACAWAVPLPTIDAQVVARSARALDRYGPDFTYAHYAVVKRLPVALGGLAGLAGVIGLAQVPPVRSLMLDRFSPGDGPSATRRAHSWFTVRFAGDGGGEHVVTEVSGGDPGYDETAKMLAESALCLAFDDLPPRSGQLTTAVAMGESLMTRLVAAGISFTVLPDAPVRPPTRAVPN